MTLTNSSRWNGMLSSHASPAAIAGSLTEAGVIGPPGGEGEKNRRWAGGQDRIGRGGNASMYSTIRTSDTTDIRSGE